MQAAKLLLLLILAITFVRVVASKSVLSLGTSLRILLPLPTTPLTTIPPFPVLSIPVGLPALSSSPSPSL